MRYAAIKQTDTVNGEGFAVSLWTQGCPFRCNGCWNDATWDFNGGNEWSQELEDELIELCKNEYKKCLSILGGEPLCEQNFDEVLKIAKRFKEELPEKKLFIWTGFTYDEVLSDRKKEILEYTDVIVTGRFILNERDLNLYLRGSRNQEVRRKKENGEFVIDHSKDRKPTVIKKEE